MREVKDKPQHTHSHVGTPGKHNILEMRINIHFAHEQAFRVFSQILSSKAGVKVTVVAVGCSGIT